MYMHDSIYHLVRFLVRQYIRADRSSFSFSGSGTSLPGGGDRVRRVFVANRSLPEEQRGTEEDPLALYELFLGVTNTVSHSR
jgi:hypothetical protein